MLEEASVPGILVIRWWVSKTRPTLRMLDEDDEERLQDYVALRGLLANPASFSERTATLVLSENGDTISTCWSVE
jgi:hypothetical protein